MKKFNKFNKFSLVFLCLAVASSGCAYAPVAQPVSTPSPKPSLSPKPAPSPVLSPVPAPTPSFSPSPVVLPSPLPVVAHGNVTFAPVEYYSSPEQRTKIASAAVKLNETIQSKCFHDFMLAQPLQETNGETVPQTVAHLQGLTGVVPVNMYYRCLRSFSCPFGTSAVAFRAPPSMEINLNAAVFTLTLSDCEWAATLAHESLGHSLGGYDHSFNWTRQREDTVPYILGGRAKIYGGDVFTACCK
jgi:hypothetical protein